MRMTALNEQLTNFAVASLLPAVIFWIWAIVNSVKKGIFDLGMVSFFTVILSSSYLLTPQGRSPGATAMYVVPLSHAFVAVNYGLGAYLSLGVKMFPRKFGIYCVVFTFLWLASTWLAWTLLSEVVHEGESEAVPESLLTKLQRKVEL